MKAAVNLTFDKIVFNKDNDLHLVVSLTAPKLDWQKSRQPILVMPVIDISGSMEGSKLEYAKESVCKLIDHLQPGDFAGVITFENEAELVAAPVEITQTKKEELKNKVKQLRTKGCTAFTAGMTLALEQVNKLKLADNVLVRVIMFTDGHANVGVSGRDILKVLTDETVGRASISMFGYGTDADQELLADLSVKAKGNYAFIRNPDDAPAAFAKELGGLLSTYASNIIVDCIPEGENKLEVLSEVKVISDNNLRSLRVPEILSEEVRNLVLNLKVLKLSQADLLPEAFLASVAKVRVSYDTLSTDGVRTSHVEELPVGITFVNPGEEQSKPTTDVDAVVALAQMVKAQVEAEKQAAAGNYVYATASMNAMADSFNARGHTAISNTVSKLGSKMASAQAYAASASYRSSTKSGGTRAYGLSSSDSEALEDMADIGVSLSNSAQDAVVGSFTGQAVPSTPDTQPSSPDASDQSNQTVTTESK